MPKLSVLVCVHNEEARLEACLSRLAFADEIVVVLDRCTDGSPAIARSLANVTVAGVFPLEGPRRSAGLAACTGDWVLEVDADEWVTFELAAEVRSRIRTAGEADWFEVPVDNYVGKTLIRHGWGGSFGTTAVARLYRAGGKTWGGQRVHPAVKVEGRCGGRLSAALVHKVDDNISDMLMRLDRYTSLKAQDMADGAKMGSVGSNVFRGFRRFWKCYFRHKGYKEGEWGFLISLMAGLYPLLSVLRARLEIMPLAIEAQRDTVSGEFEAVELASRKPLLAG